MAVVALCDFFTVLAFGGHWPASPYSPVPVLHFVEKKSRLATLCV
jgi:hypothetical protein